MTRRAALPDQAALPRPYSKAYESFVEDDDDIIGMVAYALFKGSIRQDAARRLQTGNARDPSDMMVSQLRRAAADRLDDFVQLNITENIAELQESAATEAVRDSEAALSGIIEASRNDLRELIRQRTGPVSAIAVNVVAWLVTLGATALILLLAKAADPATRVAELGHHVAQKAVPVETRPGQ